jgi:hypothetical protein
MLKIVGQVSLKDQAKNYEAITRSLVIGNQAKILDQRLKTQ